MSVTRESILQALHLCLSGIVGVTVRRNEVFPVEIPEDGLIILRDGDPGEPEVFMSPLTYCWSHNAVLEVAVQRTSSEARDAKLSELFEKISEAISQSNNLGGLCEAVTPLAPNADTLQVEGGSCIKAATVNVELTYETTTQL